MIKHKKNGPVVLAIMDGWGIEKASRGNAVTLAKTPNFDKFWKKYSKTELNASGKHVGLPRSQFGNSEAGHMNIGAGRVIKQDSVIINEAIEKGKFFKNPAFLSAIHHVKENNSQMHIIGLLSGLESAHAERKHLQALLELLSQQNIKKVYLHMFTDGRDAPQHAAAKFVRQVNQSFYNGEKIVSIMGRFYAMDRNKTWQRTEKAYELLTQGKGHVVKSAEEAIIQAYNRRETDEFIEPTSIRDNKKAVTINDNDAIIYYNLRSDRARQLTKAFVQKDFNKMNPKAFVRKKILKNIKFVAMTDFGPDLGNILTAYPSEDIKQTLPMTLDGKRQLYISESEKFAHVTYFFNGGYADPVAEESRIMIPSPKIKSYANKPEMSIKDLNKALLKNIREDKYDFICVNYANPDMVGHTGDLAAGIKAVEAVDKAIGNLVKEVLKKKGTVLITADHGNVEEMIDLETNEVDTEHSSNPVPFIIVNDKKYKLKKNKALANIAPTICDIIKVKKSRLMSADSLID